MYVVANRVYLEPEWSEVFERRFRERAGKIELEPGFLRMEVLRPADGKSPYVVVTAWESEAAFTRWVGSEHFKAAHRNPLPKEAFAREGAMERHEVVIRADRSDC